MAFGIGIGVGNSVGGMGDGGFLFSILFFLFF